MDGDALAAAMDAVTLQPNSHVTLADVCEARDAIVATGLFNVVDPVVKETSDGIALDFKLTPNAPLREVKISGATQLPPDLLDDICCKGKICDLNQVEKVCVCNTDGKRWIGWGTRTEDRQQAAANNVLLSIRCTQTCMQLCACTIVVPR